LVDALPAEPRTFADPCKPGVIPSGFSDPAQRDRDAIPSKRQRLGFSRLPTPPPDAHSDPRGHLAQRGTASLLPVCCSWAVTRVRRLTVARQPHMRSICRPPCHSPGRSRHFLGVYDTVGNLDWRVVGRSRSAAAPEAVGSYSPFRPPPHSRWGFLWRPAS
jgi:hypothetical protein